MNEKYVLDCTPLSGRDEERRQKAIRSLDNIRDGNPLRGELLRMLNSTPRCVLLAIRMIEEQLIFTAPRQQSLNWRRRNWWEEV